MAFAKKSLGQNFLMHAQTAERIAEAGQLPPNATVLEIGPGTGMLTRALLAQVGEQGRVIAVEADDQLVPELQETFAKEIGEGRLELIHEDIRFFDPASIGEPYALVANIPYYLTGEIMRTFLTTEHKPYSITVLVQKEVAERIARSNGKESVLSISVKVFGEPKYCFTVPRGSFRPAPNVDSAVISIQNVANTTFSSLSDEQHFFDVLKTGFAHKRKRLMKNLEDAYPKDGVQRAFESLSLSADIRSEDVPSDVWKPLADALA
jgi:16S rRNA (adenine1518-N6/adenine1519-N6)-dimethyltransferase